VVGGIGTTSHWVLDTSVFHQMAAAPAAPVNWTTDAVLVGIAAALAGAGTLAFRRRDLIGA